MALFEVVQVTAQYSNAVLAAIMPQVADFAKRLELPIPQPVTIGHVREFKCSPRTDLVGGRIILKTGHEFAFMHGHVEMYRSPECYYEIQDPDLVPRFFGPVRLSEKQALQVAHEAIRKLGYTAASLFADRAPVVTKPAKIGKNHVPRFRIRWNDPSRGNPENPPPSVDFEVDATTGRIHLLYLLNPDTWREGPKVAVHPPVLGKAPETEYRGGREMLPVSQAYSNAFLKAILPQFSEYIRATGFPVSLPITTNDVNMTRYICGLVDDDPMAMVDLKTGARFVYRHGQVIAFYASDVMQLPGREDPPFPQYEKFQARFFGRINMTKDEAVTLVRRTVQKLWYSEKAIRIDGPPLYIGGPAKYGTNTVARYFLNWKESREGAFRVVAEVDASTRTLKSLYINDHAITNIWRHPPRIDVPVNSSAASK